MIFFVCCPCRFEEHSGVTEADFEEQRKELSKQFGFRASSHNTVWRVLNSLITKIPNYPTYEHRVIYLDMANLVYAEGKYPRPLKKSANKVQSDLVEKEINETMSIFELAPDTKWLFRTANDELVCPSCREAEKTAMSSGEAIQIPLQCTSKYGCRCDVEPAGDYLGIEAFDMLRGLKEIKDRPWSKFWG